MSSPYDTGDAIALPATNGPQLSLAESFEAVFDSAYTVDSALGLEAEVRLRWEDNVRRYQAQTQQSINGYISDAVYSELINRRKDLGGERAFNQAYTAAIVPDAAATGDAEQVYSRVAGLGEQFKAVGLLDLDDIIDQAVENRQAIIGQNARVEGFGNTVAGFAGGVFGSIAAAVTGRDPIQFGALFAGGGGKTVATRIASEIAVNAAAEAVVQKLSIQPTRKALGEPDSPFLLSVLTAGAAGGLIRGGIEGVGALARKAFARGEPLTVDERVVRQILESRPQDPAARAGLNALDESTAYNAANPYGDTLAGTRRFNADIAEVMQVVSGRTDTAIARTLPPMDEFTIDNLDFTTQAAREEQPLIFAALNDANARLQSIDAEIADLTNQIDNLSVADGVARIDEPSADLLRSFEADASNPQLTRAKREAAARRMDQIIQSLGEENVTRQLANAAIKPRKKLQRLRQERKAAAREFKRTRKAFDAVVEGVVTRARIKELAFGKTPGNKAATAGVPFNTTALRKDVVEAQTKAIDAAHEQLPETSGRILQSMDTEAGIDLGDGNVVAREFAIIDPDNPGKFVTAEALHKRMVEDAAMLDAMTTCSKGPGL